MSGDADAANAAGAGSGAAPFASLAPGIHAVHKRVGETSFSWVERFQSALRAARLEPLPVCHGGALDPFAHGLLLLLAGPATRLMEELHPIPKYYEAVLSWGAETDTGDAAGAVTLRGDPGQLAPAQLDELLARQLGWQAQVPPATSNKRVGGERAWKKAHRGEPVSLPPSQVYLHSASFVSHDLPRSSRVSLCCRGGYYVRALARDLGRALGCGAHLTSLHRGRIGPWRDPLLAPGAEAAASAGPGLLPWLPARVLTPAEANAVELKRPIPRGAISPATLALPEGFPGPGAAAHDRPAPIRGLCEGKLRLLLRARGDALVLHTDLDGGV